MVNAFFQKQGVIKNFEYFGEFEKIFENVRYTMFGIY